MVTILSCYAFNSFILCFFYGRWYLCSLSQPSCFIRMWNWHNSSCGIAHNLDNSRKTMATNLFKSLMYSHVVAVIIIFTLLQAVWSVSVCMNAIILEIMLYSFIRYFFPDSLDWHPNNYLIACGSTDFKARLSLYSVDH